MNPLVSFLHLGQGLQRNQMWFSIFWSLCPLKTYILHSALFITFLVYLWGIALLRFRIQIWKIIFCVFEMFIIIPHQRLYSDRELHRDDPSHFCFDSITLSPTIKNYVLWSELLSWSGITCDYFSHQRLYSDRQLHRDDSSHFRFWFHITFPPQSRTTFYDQNYYQDLGLLSYLKYLPLIITSPTRDYILIANFIGMTLLPFALLAVLNFKLYTAIKELINPFLQNQLSLRNIA